MTLVMQAQCLIAVENRIKQDEANKNVACVNAIKKVVCVTKRGIYFEKTIYMVANLWSDTKNIEDYAEFVLQGILILYDDKLKDTFLSLGGKYQ